MGWSPLDYWNYPAYRSVLHHGYYDPFVDGDAFIASNSTDPGDFSEFLSGNFYLRALVSITPPVDSVLLEWGDPCNVATNAFQDFAVYEGGIASLGGTMDHAAITCSTGLEKSWIVPPGGGDRFWCSILTRRSNGWRQGHWRTQPCS